MSRRRTFTTRSITLYHLDAESADHPDAFEVGALLEYPSRQWWREANPLPPPVIVKQQPKIAPPPKAPTRAAYWSSKPRKRLTRSTPLPNESKPAAKERARKAKRYFAQLDNYESILEKSKRRAKVVTGRAEARIVLRGYVAHVPGPGQQPEKITDGRQSSPWIKLPRGGYLDDLKLQSLYYETARRAVALEAKAHAPAWDASLGTFDQKQGYTDSDKGFIFPDGGVLLELRVYDV